jgi:hypothetical protein
VEGEEEASDLCYSQWMRRRRRRRRRVQDRFCHLPGKKKRMGRR